MTISVHKSFMLPTYYFILRVENTEVYRSPAKYISYSRAYEAAEAKLSELD